MPQAFLALHLPVFVALFESWREWLIAQTSHGWAEVWLAGVAFAESSFFPIPPDVLLIALMVTDAYVGQWSWALYFALICSLGSVLGGIAGYAIGYYGGRPVLVRFVAPERITYVEQAFDRYGVWAVAVAGFTPVPYKVFTIAAGAFRFNVPRFVLASAVSRSLRFFAVASVMALLGVPGQQWLEANLVLFTVAVVLLLALAVFVLHRWAARRRRARAKALEAVYGTTSPGGPVQIEPDNEPGTQSSERRPSET